MKQVKNVIDVRVISVVSSNVETKNLEFTVPEWGKEDVFEMEGEPYFDDYSGEFAVLYWMNPSYTR